LPHRTLFLNILVVQQLFFSYKKTLALFLTSSAGDQPHREPFCKGVALKKVATHEASCLSVGLHQVRLRLAQIQSLKESAKQVFS
jgi:hypothetical protein